MGYLDQNGNTVNLGRQLGRRGGEGAVYQAISHPGYVVKIYHEVADDIKSAKLWHLCQIGNAEILKFAAWPTSLVWDSQNKIRGILMPVIDGKEVHQLFGPKERFIEFPHAKWDFLIHVARNCAAAFDEVHKLGVVIGDVNEGNVMVRRDGLIRLIDCDSYQAQKNGYLWTCDVGINFWTPPELQNRPFRGLRRAPNHDLFGLAVLIFKLLFMGRHPYSGTPLTKGEFDLEQAIANYKFAYSERAAQFGMKPPPNSLPFDVFPKNFRELFERAFTHGSERDGARPSAREWVMALDSFQKNLRACQHDSSHNFPSHISSCPWCDITKNGGPNFFVNIRVAVQQGKVSIQLWNAISRITPLSDSSYSPTKVPLISCKAGPLPPPETTFRTAFGFGLVLLFIGILILVGGTFAIGAGVTVIGCGLMYTGAFNSSYVLLRKQRTEKFNQMWNTLQNKLNENEALQKAYKQAFTSTKSELRRKYDRLTNLDTERKGAIKSLEAQKRQLQLDAFLDRQLLMHAKILGIGPKKRQTLLSFGIETAYDVIKAQTVPGIGTFYYSRLMAWRKSCETRFNFNPNQAIPASDLHQINVKFSNIFRSLEGELMAGPSKLQQINRNMSDQKEPLDRQIQDLIQLCSQAKTDLEAVPAD